MVIRERPVIRRLNSQQDLKAIPVVILTTSSYDRDIQTCYDAGANSFIQKPTELSAYYETIRRVKEFWLDLAKLPDE